MLQHYEILAAEPERRHHLKTRFDSQRKHIQKQLDASQEAHFNAHFATRKPSSPRQASHGLHLTLICMEQAERDKEAAMRREEKRTLGARRAAMIAEAEVCAWP